MVVFGSSASDRKKLGSSSASRKRYRLVSLKGLIPAAGFSCQGMHTLSTNG
jgi:hypothetical protein